MDFQQRPQKTTETGRSLFDSSAFKESFARTSATRTSTTSPGLRPVRRTRSAELIAAIRRLDATIDESAQRELGDWIRAEYEAEFGPDQDIPLGLVGVCYLGPPFIEHRLDFSHIILGHFSATQPMPAPFEQSRMLVRSGTYEYVEVYASGQIIPVHSDGTPVVPARKEK